MIVLFHEFTHNYQYFMSSKNNYNESGVVFAIHSILNKKLNDYSNNHDNNDIEIDYYQIVKK